jgi:imidazole glycerol-phosphate synthase subunit HisH
MVQRVRKCGAKVNCAISYDVELMTHLEKKIMKSSSVTLIDSGLCNLTSVRNALEYLGAKVTVVATGTKLKNTSRIILPGVGSFGRGMEYLRERGLAEPLKTLALQGVPLLGICLGMQLLAQKGDESGPCDGLGLVAGHVRRIQFSEDTLRLPHVGWNEITFTRPTPLWASLPEPLTLYFTHSFILMEGDDNDIIGTCDYGEPRVVAVQRGNIFGIQAHPEKSQKHGLALLKNFLTLPS